MNNLTSVETFYAFSAIIGGVLFLIRTILSLVGADADADFDMGGTDLGGVDIGHDLQGHLGDHSGIDSHGASFNLFSMHSITGFFLMFGLIGLSLSKAGLPELLTAIGGMAAGAFTMLVVALIYYFMQRLQSDGTMKIETAVGKTGTVYLSLPEKGSGQVSIVVQGGLKQFDAISADKTRIPTGEEVRVVRILNGKTLVVERVE
jgi:membrane protein implicated in regulation of membrane protease activity